MISRKFTGPFWSRSASSCKSPVARIAMNGEVLKKLPSPSNTDPTAVRQCAAGLGSLKNPLPKAVFLPRGSKHENPQSKAVELRERPTGPNKPPPLGGLTGVLECSELARINAGLKLKITWDSRHSWQVAFVVPAP